MNRTGYCLALVTIGLAGISSTPAHAQAGRKISFSKDVLPIFQNRCAICHGVGASGELKLDNFENLMMGGKSGMVIQPGDPNTSKLLMMVEGRVQPKMPPGNQKPLTNIEKFTLRSWIQQGVRNDSDGTDMAAGAEKALEISEPKDGANVRETVRVVIPRASVPPEGFVAIYIDGQFKAALAPPAVEELEQKKLPLDSPVVYLWDTKAPLSENRNVAAEDRFAADGPHVIEVRSYKNDGTQAETKATQVNLQNSIEFATNKPVPLTYASTPKSVGRQYRLEHVVDLEAKAAATGPVRRFGQPPAAGGGGGGGSLTHKETTRYLVSLEDVSEASGAGFWRERRESPIIVVVNGLKQIVRLDTSSRYYSLDREGNARRSRQMEREAREPILNPLSLPGRPHRMNETFGTTLRVNLGAYIPSVLKVDNIEATTEGIEWQFGEPCVRIKLTYLAGKSKLDVNSLRIQGGDLEVQQGTSTIWFSEKTNRVLKAKHDITGTLSVPVAQGGGMGMMGGAMGGGEYGPGMMGGPGAPGEGGGYPGVGGPGGYPGVGGPGAGFGAPFAPMGFGGGAAPGPAGFPGAGGMPGAPGGFSSPGVPGAPGAPGAPAGYPGVGGPGGYPGVGGPGGYPGVGGPGGYPGVGGPGGYPGMGGPGGYPGMGGMMGGGAAAEPSQFKRYHVTLKVATSLMAEEPQDTKSVKK